MNALEEHAVQCPNCWETITVLVDCSVARQEYTEDCPVCCRPFRVRVSTGEPTTVDLLHEDEA